MTDCPRPEPCRKGWLTQPQALTSTDRHPTTRPRRAHTELFVTRRRPSTRQSPSPLWKTKQKPNPREVLGTTKRHRTVSRSLIPNLGHLCPSLLGISYRERVPTQWSYGSVYGLCSSMKRIWAHQHQNCFQSSPWVLCGEEPHVIRQLHLVAVAGLPLASAHSS